MSQPTEPPSQNPEAGTQDPAPAEDQGNEKAFWDRLGQVIETRVDAVVEKRLKGMRDNSTGTSRTGAKRATLPGMIADLVFGPEKKE